MLQQVVGMYSWLNFATAYVDRGVVFWTPPSVRRVEVQPDDIAHVVSAGERLDLISERYYQTADLDWLIALENDLPDMTTGLYPTQVLRVPSPRYVKTVWLRKAGR